MLPEDNACYGKQSYWEERYQTEEHYDWFPSVYQSCLDTIFNRIEEVYEKQCTSGSRQAGEKLLVLHLGTGNSALVHDLHQLYMKKYGVPGDAPSSSIQDSSNTEAMPPPPYTLFQVAMDYSDTVIDRMSKKYPSASIDWRVADVRDLSSLRQSYPSGFDLIVDKGTMDALQADKADENMEENIHAMLRETSLSLRPASIYSQFIQVTWEVPLYRLFYTLDKDHHLPYIWKDNERHCLVGDSDMYRIFTYEVMPEDS